MECLEGSASEHTAERGYNPSPNPNSNPNPKKNEDLWRWHDLDPNATCIILTDGLKIDSNATPRVENALLLPAYIDTRYRSTPAPSPAPRGAHFVHLLLQAAHRMH